MKMNLEKWTERAMKKVAKMSPQQKIAMINALDTTLRNDTGHELIHTDVSFDVISAFADAYDIDLRWDDEDMKEHYEEFEYVPNPDNVVELSAPRPVIDFQVFNGKEWIFVDAKAVKE